MTDLSAQLEEIARRMAYSHGGKTPSLAKKDVVERILELAKENAEHWSEIARILDKEGVPTPAGAKKWSPSTVKRIALKHKKKKWK